MKMFVRKFGDVFELERGKKTYTLEVIQDSEGDCSACFFFKHGACQKTQAERKITGGCDGSAVFVQKSVRDRAHELSKKDVAVLADAVKSIGGAMKIVEMFKQASQKQ